MRARGGGFDPQGLEKGVHPRFFSLEFEEDPGAVVADVPADAEAAGEDMGEGSEADPLHDPAHVHVAPNDRHGGQHGAGGHDRHVVAEARVVGIACSCHNA